MGDHIGNKLKKGAFGRIGLPVAKRYPALTSKTLLYLVGGVGALIVAGLFVLDVTLFKGESIVSGPISSNHAGIGTDCASCHTPNEGVIDQKCEVCHEKFGDDLGIHTFEAHYQYRSNDFSRVIPSVDEVNCATCHTEHEGRDAPATVIADTQCESCHGFDGFNTEHPEFDFVAEQLLDESNIKFPHVLHVSELQRKEKLSDIEKTCLYCHNAEEDGKGFQPLSFERHCDSCHLSTSDGTPFVNIASASTPGVKTLGTIQNQQLPGTRWSFFTNPEEFQSRGNTVRKRPVYHADPWVLENLRQLRNVLYPSSNLADLLLTSADVSPQNSLVLYKEAIETLRTYTEELRNQPSRQVQTELRAAEELLQQVEKKLNDPLQPQDETQFIVSASALNTSLSAEQLGTYERVIDGLTQPCQTCHVVDNATIKRVQTDQKTMLRADFDHGAHIIQARCVDCHNEIPIRELVGIDSLPPIEVDRAEIHNLPAITSCQTCHTDDLAANTCVTCHAFHPDKTQRSNLLLYLE
ncbi:MAG: cytochrome c3 family protein [Rhodothermales bacterium]